jgi:hypothetical protein
VTDDFTGDSGGLASQGAYGPPARWATLVSPVAPESVVLVLSSSRQWRVKQLGSGFLLFGSGLLGQVVAEAEIVPTDTGCRIQIALQRTETSGVPVAVAAVLTTGVAVGACVAWWLSSSMWWVGALGAGAGFVATGVLADRRSRRVTDEERAALVQQIAKALRGWEVAA